jgi:hypothetical protein
LVLIVTTIHPLETLSPVEAWRSTGQKQCPCNPRRPVAFA